MLSYGMMPVTLLQGVRMLAYRTTKLKKPAEVKKNIPLRAAEHALERGHFHSAEAILSEHPELLQQMFRDTAMLPLGIACERGRADFVRLFIKLGADIDEADCDGLTALHLACYKNQLECGKILLDHGADCYYDCDCWGLTPIGLACKLNRLEFLQLLIDSNVDLEHCDDDGLTSLHVACELGSTKCVELLLQHGANARALTHAKETPLQLAKDKGHKSIAQIIQHFLDEDLC